MESPALENFDISAVKLEATEECSNNANNTDFDSLCWLKKENQDQVDEVLAKTEQKYQFNDDLNNILDNSTFTKAHHGIDESNHFGNHENANQEQEQHMNLNNQNNMPFIESEINGAEKNDHEEMEEKMKNDNEMNLEEKIGNNHEPSSFEEETENKNDLVSFDDFGPETCVDEIVPTEKLNDDEANDENEDLMPMETTISSSPSIEVTTNTFDELNFQEKAEEVIITPSSDLDDDSVDKQLSSVDVTNTISEVEEEEPDDVPKSLVTTEPEIDKNIIASEDHLLKSPETETPIDQNIMAEVQNSLIENSECFLNLEIESHELGAAAANIDSNKDTFIDEEEHFESTMNDSKANIVSDSAAKHSNDSLDESDEEWNYMKAKEGQTEKENDFSEEFKENIEPVTEKEISSVELKEQLDTPPIETAPIVPHIDTRSDLNLTSPKEPVSFNLQNTPELMIEEADFHLNPEAKEFIPTSYTSPVSPVIEHQNGDAESNSLQLKPKQYGHVFDEVLSQSPRKGRESNMDDLQLPAENDFDDEIANRPHELLNDDVKMPEESVQIIEEIITPEQPNENELLIQQTLENAGMKESLYIENTSSVFNNGEMDLLNSIQTLPNDVELEESNILSNKEGLSLEIDEKDVISPSSEDIKEIVSEIQEKLDVMQINETAPVPVPAEDPKQHEFVDPVPNEPDLQRTNLILEEECKPQQVLESEPVLELPSKEVKEIGEVKVESVVESSTDIAERLIPIEESARVEESMNTNGNINVEELNKKNLEESAKLEKLKDEDSKMLEATLGAVAITAAVAATVKTSTTKKSTSAKSTASSSVKSKPTTASSAAKKVGSASNTSAAAARPKTAPVKTIDRKTATTSATSKPKTDIKKTGNATTTISKPKEITKAPEIKKTNSAKTTVSKASSTTVGFKPRPASATLTNGISKTQSSKTSATANSAIKQTTSTSPLTKQVTSTTSKTRLSPRSTVSSTLRKNETMKSPSVPKTISRVDSGLKNSAAAAAPKTAAAATLTKPPTSNLRSKPAMGTTSTTASKKLTGKPTTTSQRNTQSPLGKKKTLAPAGSGSPPGKKSLNADKSSAPEKPGSGKPIETDVSISSTTAQTETNGDVATPVEEPKPVLAEVETTASPASVNLPIA